MKAYSEYKDSGVQWLGKVPSHWEILAFKYCMKINNGQDYKHILADEGYPVFGSGGPFAFASQYIYDGEVVMFGRKGTIDKPLYYKGKFWTVDTMFYAIPKKRSVCRFMYYLARTFPFNYYSTATALPSMTQFDLGNNPVALPSLPEQQAIASFLDAKTKPLDDIIAKRERQVELLEEMKSAIISRAVTKGLNSEAKMKDSGIEWIGEIPDHWDVKCIKYIKANVPNAFVDGPFGSNLKSQHYVEDGDVYVIESGFITSGKFEYVRDMKTITEEHFETIKRSECKENDIIIAKIGAYFGMAAVLPKLDKKSVVSGNSLKITLDNTIILKSADSSH